MSTKTSSAARDLVDEFFREQFLWWLEVLSLESDLRAGIDSLRDVRLWLQDMEAEPMGVKRSWVNRVFSHRKDKYPIDLLALADDCERFALWFFDPMKASAPHIYHSALPWAPTSSLTREVYQGQLMDKAKLVNAVDFNWNACIRTIPVDDHVRRVEFSHKGALIAVLGRNCTKIFDAVTGACHSTFDERQSVQTIAFSPDDSFLVSGFGHGIVDVLDARKATPRLMYRGHTSSVNSTAFSPSGALIASGADDKTIRIWNFSRREFREFSFEGHEGAVRAVCWSANEGEVISGSSDNTIRIWNISEKKCSKIICEHTQMVTSVASFNDLIASGSKDGRVKIYHSGSEVAVQTISTNEQISSVQFSAHGDKLMYTDLHSASVWDLDKKRCVLTIGLDGNGARFSLEDGTFLASWSDASVKILKPIYGRSNSKAVAARHSREVVDVSFAPDGQLVASRSDGDIKIWDTTTGECLFTFDCDGDTSITFSRNSEFITYSRDRRPVKELEWIIWNIRPNIRPRRLVKKMDCNAKLVALSSDGTRMASVSYAVVELWSLTTRKRQKCLARVEVHDLPPNRTISKIAFDSDDGSRVFVTTDDGWTQSWRICPASLSNSHSSKNKTSASLPFVFDPIQETRSLQDTSVLAQFEINHEWIMLRDRILWLPANRRGPFDVNGKKVVLGTGSGIVYIVDFSGALLS